MKIKSDFITNSSSSSFIVAWPKKIKSIKDVLLYIPHKGKAERIYKDKDLNPTSLVNRQGMLIKPNKKNIIESIYPIIETGYLDEIIFQVNIKDTIYTRGAVGGYKEFKESFKNRHKISSEEWHKYPDLNKTAYSEYRNHQKFLSILIAISFCEENINHYLYFFTYSDEDGSFSSEMEHGNTFANLPHITISHH